MLGHPPRVTWNIALPKSINPHSSSYRCRINCFLSVSITHEGQCLFLPIPLVFWEHVSRNKCFCLHVWLPYWNGLLRQWPSLKSHLRDIWLSSAECCAWHFWICPTSWFQIEWINTIWFDYLPIEFFLSKFFYYFNFSSHPLSNIFMLVCCLL